ncbi:MAG: hypothetical protein JW889_06935 [Verrucomicrobia bacterium]|nr:hypothetical protein [Verrucomicrobiota bacterium]
MKKANLPFRKALHTLARKQLCRTVVIEQGPESSEFAAECHAYGRAGISCRRFHFFSEALASEAEIADNLKAYQGYCDLRPDGSVAHGLISRAVIVRPGDTYAYLVCSLKEEITLPTGHKVTVCGFPHVEKDGGAVMCAQAAIATVVQYWNSKRPSTFTAVTGPDISREAGVSTTEMLPDSGRGLDSQEIRSFFNAQGMDCRCIPFAHLPTETIRQQRPSTKIYGYMESGFPVIAAVKTSGGLHALTFIGHTLDKNAWSAIADPSYYNRPVSGHGIYHSNLTWVRHFIVQDDNMGPYYFLPTDLLPDIVSALFVAMPNGTTAIEPDQAESAAFAGLAKLLPLIDKARGNRRMQSRNRDWIQEMFRHFDPQGGEGWVLRPILRTGADIADSYRDHEFHRKVVNRFSGPLRNRYFWRVEISWPHLFCFHENSFGEIVLDAQNSKLVMLHVPGLLVRVRADDTPGCSKDFAKNEDGPRGVTSPVRHQAAHGL